MRSLHSYVGPKKIADRAPNSPSGFLVESPTALRCWIWQTDQEWENSGNITATFVVDELGQLRVADRRSEHVLSAGGRPVRSAGEITFTLDAGTVRVTWVTNQST